MGPIITKQYLAPCIFILRMTISRNNSVIFVMEIYVEEDKGVYIFNKNFSHIHLTKLFLSMCKFILKMLCDIHKFMELIYGTTFTCRCINDWEKVITD